MAMLVWGVFFPVSSHSQDCGPAKQRIYRMSEAQRVPDSLRTMLDLIAFVRACETQPSIELQNWLLNNEVFVLDRLEQYERADTLVTRFFDTYFDKEETSDYYRAKFYMWRFKLRSLAGALVDMTVAYTEAQRYAKALDKTFRASLYVDGALAYFEGREYDKTLALAQQGRDLIGTPQTYDERQIVARALLWEAEAQLWLDTDLPQAREKLGQAIAFYSGLDNASKVAVATSLLGQVHAAEGDTSQALSVMPTATQLARQSGTVRSQAYTLWHHGRLLRHHKDYDAAQPVLTQALEAAKICQEFYLEAAYDLARLHEQQRAYDQATHFYQVVLDAPRPRRPAAALAAQRKAEAAQVRLMLIETEQRLAQSERRLQHVLYAGSGGFALLFVLGGAGFLFVLRRNQPPKPPLVVEKATGGFRIIPVNLPTGLSLDQLKQRFQDKMEAERAGRCWAYAYAALLDPELILPYLKEGPPWLADLAEHVEADSLPNNRTLMQCVIAIETAVDHETFGKNPENTMLRLFQRECDKRGWTRPTHPTEWKQHFTEYHLDLLFDRPAL